MTDNLVVPQIHIQCELVIDTFHVKGCPIAHNTLHRSIDLHFGQEQIGKDSVWITRLFVLVMFRFALNTSGLTALMGIRIRKNKSGVQTNLRIQPTVTVRGKSEVIFLKQKNIAFSEKRLCVTNCPKAQF